MKRRTFVKATMGALTKCSLSELRAKADRRRNCLTTGRDSGIWFEAGPVIAYQSAL